MGSEMDMIADSATDFSVHAGLTGGQKRQGQATAAPAAKRRLVESPSVYSAALQAQYISDDEDGPVIDLTQLSESEDGSDTALSDTEAMHDTDLDGVVTVWGIQTPAVPAISFVPQSDPADALVCPAQVDKPCRSRGAVPDVFMVPYVPQRLEGRPAGAEHLEADPTPVQVTSTHSGPVSVVSVNADCAAVMDRSGASDDAWDAASSHSDVVTGLVPVDVPLEATTGLAASYSSPTSLTTMSGRAYPGDDGTG